MRCATRARQRQRGIEGHGARRPFGSRIRKREAAAERARIANRDVTDVRGRVGKQRNEAANARLLIGGAVLGAGAKERPTTAGLLMGSIGVSLGRLARRLYPPNRESKI